MGGPATVWPLRRGFRADGREGWAAAVSPLPNTPEPPRMADALCQLSQTQVLTNTDPGQTGTPS